MVSFALLHVKIPSKLPQKRPWLCQTGLTRAGAEVKEADKLLTKIKSTRFQLCQVFM